MAHAGHVAAQLERHPEAAEQVAYADRILLNHIDGLGEPELAAAEAALRTRNAAAPIERTAHAACEVGRLLRLGAGQEAVAGGWRLMDLRPSPPPTTPTAWAP